MSFATTPDYNQWESIPKLGVKVNVETGHVVNLDTNKHVNVYRNTKLGVIQAVVPKNEGLNGFGKGRIVHMGRIVLYAVNGGSPSVNPRKILALPKDGNKWNWRPNNLEWVSRKEYQERLIVEGNVPLKLNVHKVLTIKDVVERLAKEGINDRDAIGFSFGIGAQMVWRIAARRSWGFASAYVGKIPARAADHQIHKARETVALFSDYDQGMSDYIASYGVNEAAS